MKGIDIRVWVKMTEESLESMRAEYAAQFGVTADRVGWRRGGRNMFLFLKQGYFRRVPNPSPGKRRRS